jgi:hypothetical protein
MDKKVLAAQLQKLGIKVEGNRVKKSEILKALAQAADPAEQFARLKKLAKGTDFEDFDKDEKLKEVIEDHLDMFEEMPDQQVEVLFNGDYHQGYESHSFDNKFVENVKSFVSDAGKVLGWDLDEEEDEEDPFGIDDSDEEEEDEEDSLSSVSEAKSGKYNVWALKSNGFSTSWTHLFGPKSHAEAEKFAKEKHAGDSILAIKLLPADAHPEEHYKKTDAYDPEKNKTDPYHIKGYGDEKNK